MRTSEIFLEPGTPVLKKRVGEVILKLDYERIGHFNYKLEKLVRFLRDCHSVWWYQDISPFSSPVYLTIYGPCREKWDLHHRLFGIKRLSYLSSSTEISLTVMELWDLFFSFPAEHKMTCIAWDGETCGNMFQGEYVNKSKFVVILILVKQIVGR